MDSIIANRRHHGAGRITDAVCKLFVCKRDCRAPDAIIPVLWPPDGVFPIATAAEDCPSHLRAAAGAFYLECLRTMFTDDSLTHVHVEDAPLA